jgi:uncharacterized protein
LKSVYIETSALIKIFVEDSSSQHSERLILLAKEGSVRLILSDWVINETIALIENNIKKKVIKPREAHQILSEIMSMIEGKVQYLHFTFFGINESVVVESRITIQDLGISASDALHVYIAKNVGCHAFISSRAELVNRLFDAKLLREGNIEFESFNVESSNDMKRLFEFLSQ